MFEPTLRHVVGRLFSSRSLAATVLGSSALLFAACAERPISSDVTQTDPSSETADSSGADTMTTDSSTPSSSEIATLGAGCFWCVEAVLEQLDGVLSVSSGYMGGESANPSYKDVCTGTTGHAEVVQVEFDPNTISYDAILAWFWRLHDPTTLNRQGADVGTQYRSVIFYHSEAQRESALRSKELAQPDFSDPIVTEISEAGPYYPAEAYHQDYYQNNKTQGYCRAVIAPKLDKLGLEK